MTKKLDEKSFSQYTIQTKCSPDSIKFWVNKPFWIEPITGESGFYRIKKKEAEG